MPLQRWHVLATALLCYSLLHWQAALAMPFAGPWLAYTENWSPCQDKEWNHNSFFDISTSKFNDKKPLELQLISGFMNFSGMKQNIDDTFWGHVRLDSWSQGEWKLNAFVFKYPITACSAVKDNIPGFVKATFGTEVLNAKPCRFLPRLYKFDNRPVNWTFPKFPIMPYGHWRFHFTMGQASDTHICHNVECHTIPKPKPVSP